jgi:nitrite reductase (NADH) small subunit
MHDFEIGSADAIPAGSGRMFQIGQQYVYVANIGGRYHAIDAVCPHRAAMLGQGPLHGSVLTCPWHQWQFDVTTGKGITNPLSSVRTFPVSVRDGVLCVTVEQTPAAPAQTG